jgi:hypothetical protein
VESWLISERVRRDREMVDVGDAEAYNTLAENGFDVVGQEGS